MRRTMSGEEMDFKRIVECMSARMPWPVGSLVLYEQKIERGRGWEKTLERVKNDEKFAVKTDALRDALFEHVLCGEKLVKLFAADEQTIAATIDRLQQIEIVPNAASEAFPCALRDSDLKKQSDGMSLTAITKVEDGWAVVFSSVRSIVIREMLDVDSLPLELAERFNDFEELVGVRKVRFHAHDVVFLPSVGNQVEIRTDFPMGTPGEAAEAAHIGLKHAFNGMIGQDIFNEPINLFPLIDSMYGDDKEGTVVELAFATTTGSIKHEKMRRKAASLRTEKYHVGGKAALEAPIEPYKLSIVWHLAVDKNRSSAPELSLNSSARMSGSTSPTMFSAVIRKCAGCDDYKHVSERISTHLSAPRLATE